MDTAIRLVDSIGIIVIVYGGLIVLGLLMDLAERRGNEGGRGVAEPRDHSNEEKCGYKDHSYSRGAPRGGAAAPKDTDT